MPKDQWASTRRRDAVRRAKAGGWSGRKPTKTKKSKIRKQMASAKQLQAKILGHSKPKKVTRSAPTVEIKEGALVEIRRTGEAWAPHVMRTTLQLRPRGESEGRYVFWFKGWQIRGPRPTGP